MRDECKRSNPRASSCYSLVGKPCKLTCTYGVGALTAYSSATSATTNTEFFRSSRESRLAMDEALHLRSILGQHIPLYHAMRQFDDATVPDCITTFHKVRAYTAPRWVASLSAYFYFDIAVPCQPIKVWSEEEEEGQQQSTPLDQNQLLFGVAGFPTALHPWHTPVWLARFVDGETSSRKLARVSEGALTYRRLREYFLVNCAYVKLT